MFVKLSLYCISHLSVRLFILQKLVNVVGLVSRVVDADGFMFVWTLGVQPDVIIKMK